MEKLKEKLVLHKDWLLDNTKGKLLDLSGAKLSGADLSGADLRYANLSNVKLSGAKLSGTDLSGADLSGADLSGADLRYANLSNVKLSNVKLSGAKLSGADLSGADLRYANLSGADLRYANLRYCIGNSKEIKSLQIGTYLISYTKTILSIGCQSYTHSEWRTFSDSIIIDMDGQKALDWWNLNKTIIFELIDREANL